MSGLVTGAGDHAGQVTQRDQEAVVAAQQVLRSSGRPVLGAVTVRPAVQPVMVAA